METIFFIHHIQQCINISKILRNIGVQLSSQIKTLSSDEDVSDSQESKIPEEFVKS